MLPGLLARALIPLGFMPTFGPGLSVGLMLCPAYAPVWTRGPVRTGYVAHAGANNSMDMSTGTDMSMDMPDAFKASVGVDWPKPLRQGQRPTAPTHGNHDRQYDSLFHYLASSVLGAMPSGVELASADQPATNPALPTPQVSYFLISPRAQSARAPPHPA